MRKMPFDVTRTSDVPASFRVDTIKSKFDLDRDKITERFVGELALPDEWSVGVIVGASGTGKTTIAGELFGAKPPRVWGGKPLIDEIAPERTVDEVVDVFNKVGFSSPPSWLKPYAVLSNGEKMRADLAAAVLSGDDPIVFDEFTSVVDRQVAKVGSHAVAKHVRRHGLKFVAVTCHSDILDWLEPDWVFDTNEMRFFGPGPAKDGCSSGPESRSSSPRSAARRGPSFAATTI